MPAALPSELAAKRERLLAILRDCESVAVALSGGVDSAVVAQAAAIALGDRAVAVTGVSASLADGEEGQARDVALRIGIRHIPIATREVEDPQYRANNSQRCYHCKSELYDAMAALCSAEGIATIVNGANVDDRGDWRPGMRAAHERAVRSPLLEAEITKEEVRALAASWDLPVWDKPASPCLSSRIAYGVAVTPERLAAIDRAEQILRRLGLRELRVRLHADDLARIEVPAESIARLADPAVRESICRQFRALGLNYVTLDLEGFRSGSLNRVIPIEELTQPLT